jgi:hypothetical protein
MGDFLLDMEWHVCLDGYHREPSALGWMCPERLVANSESIRTYEPFQKYEMLYSAFAKLKTQDDVLGFINRFGPINSAYRLDIVSHLRHAKAFRELLSAKQESTKKVCSTLKRHMALDQAPLSKGSAKEITPSHERRASELAADQTAAWRHQFIPVFKVDRSNRIDPKQKPVYINQVMAADLPLLMGEVHLEPDPEEGVRLKIRPNSLMQGLWVQLARKLSSKTILRTCRYCGSAFEAGAGSKRRADATFCSSEHSIRFHSLKRFRGA